MGDRAHDAGIIFTVFMVLAAIVLMGTIPTAWYACTKGSTKLAIVGFLLSLCALVFETVAWGHWVDKIADEHGYDYEWGFIIALVVWWLLILYVFLWLGLWCAMGGMGCLKLSSTKGSHSVRESTGISGNGDDTTITLQPVFVPHGKHDSSGVRRVPRGCTDFGLINGKFGPLDCEGDLRCAGNTKIGFGFELTQDIDDQQGHLLCRVPLVATGAEIHCSFEYLMKPKACDENGGQGLCVYLIDPSVAGWDRKFDGTGPLGFVGKAGAIVGVGIDCTGEFCDGQPASIALKRANDAKLLCDPVHLEGGVVTKDDKWRKVEIKFDIEENKCDVTIGGEKVLDDIPFEGIKIPSTVCIGVCAGTSHGKSNHMCVNNLKIKNELDPN